MTAAAPCVPLGRPQCHLTVRIVVDAAPVTPRGPGSLQSCSGALCSQGPAGTGHRLIPGTQHASLGRLLDSGDEGQLSPRCSPRPGHGPEPSLPPAPRVVLLGALDTPPQASRCLASAHPGETVGPGSEGRAARVPGNMSIACGHHGQRRPPERTPRGHRPPDTRK